MSERPTHEELDFFMDNPLLGIVYLDKQDRIVRCNVKFEEMFGYKLEEIKRKNLDEVIDGDQDMTMITQTGESIHGSGKRKRKNGTYMDVEIYGKPKILGGSISGTLGVYLDITDRKLAKAMLVKSQHGLEERVKERTADLSRVNEQLQEEIVAREQIQETLRESEEKYRTILESIEESYFEIDIAGNFIFFNDSLSKGLGYSNDELLGMNNRDYISPEAYKKVYNLFNQSYRTGNPIKKATYEIIRKDGSRGFHEMSSSVMKDKAGQTIGFRGIAHDITERAKAEEALRESEEKYKRVVENALIGICQVEKSGGFIMANQRIAEMFGYDSPENLLSSGVNIADLYVDPEERAMIHQELDVKGSLPGKILRLKKKTGEHFWVKYHVRMLRKNGKTIYEGLWEDITKEKTLTENLERAHKMEAIGTLAGGVAHDLNNILGGLVSYPELLLLKLPEDSPLRDMVSTIQKSGEKAAATVQDLLTLARRGLLVTELINLNDVVSEYLQSPEHNKLQAYHPEVHLETSLERYPLHIEGSPIHLSKTVMNLISNAAEAMPEGGKLTVSLENKYIDRPVSGYDNMDEGDYMVLTVSDTGTGISPNDIEKIFEPFYTKKKLGRSGTGLGMAVVWGTVKDHKGYIDVQSSEGQGTTFTLYFPATRKKLPEDETPLSVESYRGNGESILVIDDVEEQRKIATGMLEELCYSVTSVSSGEEAVEYLKTNKADLILLDMIMDPGMDGLDTYKKILEIYPGQKAIIASGFSETDHVKEVQSLGAGAYIRKPLLLEKIGLAVMEELEK